MKETPIIYSTPMVRAYLDGLKTMTRRVLTPNTSIVGVGRVDWSKFCWDGSQIYKDTCTHGHIEESKAPLPFVDGRASLDYPYEHQYLHVPWNWEEDMTIFRIFPKWDVGDILWVRESFSAGARNQEPFGIIYKADGTPLPSAIERGTYEAHPGWGKWRPSIHMFRKDSRITQTITEIRVERLQDITEEDAKAEGVIRYPQKIRAGQFYRALTDWEHEAYPLKWGFKKGEILKAHYPSLGLANFYSTDPNGCKDVIIMKPKEAFTMLEDVALSYRDAYFILWDKLNGKKYPTSLNPWNWVISYPAYKEVK